MSELPLCSLASDRAETERVKRAWWMARATLPLPLPPPARGRRRDLRPRIRLRRTPLPPMAAVGEAPPPGWCSARGRGWYGAAANSSEQPGAADPSREQPGADATSSGQPGAADPSREQPGAAGPSRSEQVEARRERHGASVGAKQDACGKDGRHCAAPWLPCAIFRDAEHAVDHLSSCRQGRQGQHPSTAR